MVKIEPTHEEIMQHLDCCFYGKWHKGQCECHNKAQFKDCYEAAKAQLTKTVLTEEEIKQRQEQNTKAMKAIDETLSLFHGDEE